MPRAPARRAAVAIAAAAVVIGIGPRQSGGQDLDAAVSGFAIAPPAGYVARAAAPSSASRFVIGLTKPDEPGTACEVSFEALPGFEQFTQEALNRQTERPGWEEFYREGLGAFYDVRSVEAFEHAGVRGAVVFGVSMKKPAVRGWIADRPALIFMLYTPKGLGKVTCFAEAPMFDARRAEFEAVARGLTLPR
jgi:hypothetical protein